MKKIDCCISRERKRENVSNDFYLLCINKILMLIVAIKLFRALNAFMCDHGGGGGELSDTTSSLCLNQPMHSMIRPASYY